MLAVGTYLADRYEILDKIGAGGMSDVYKAKDHILGRFVAIKVLKAEFSEDRSFVTKFRTEAQSAAGLEHPNIVNIYDVGSEEGLHYIVMEYVEGITLKTYVEKKGKLSFKESASIAIQVARGIEAAHNKQITHRDIKPQNIMISTEGKVKVTDFGIARAASSNTISSDVMGSVHYSSPEQARNGFVDGRSDIYSLGIVMYEMVTGRVPFDGDTTVAVAIQHLQEEMVEPSRYAEDLPVSMEKIILKCTQKNPDRRYQTIGELLSDLRKSLASPDEDFVVIAPAVDNGKTKVISGAELKQIRERGIDASAEQAESAGAADSILPPDLEDDEDYDDEDEEGLNPKLDKAVTIFGIIMAAVILIVIIYLIGSVFGLFRYRDKGEEAKDSESQQTESQMESESEPQSQAESESQKSVPMIRVIDMLKDEAQDRLDQMGLYMFVIAVQKSDKPEGTIIDQDIAEGTTVPEGTTVNVVVAGSENIDYSSGTNGEDSTPEKVIVKDVRGMMENDAVRTLEGQGLHASKKYEYSDSIDAGKVISQYPGSGSSVDAGSTVSIVVSQGKRSVKVPSVLGETEKNATKILKDAGLTVQVAEAYSDTVEAGLVISQSIKSEKTVPAGTEITITVSLGPEVIDEPDEPEPDVPDEPGADVPDEPEDAYYSYEATYSAPEGAVSASYTLSESGGGNYSGSEDVDGSLYVSFDDLTSSSGTLTIVWTIVTVDEEGLSETTTETNSYNVTFTPQ